MDLVSYKRGDLKIMKGGRGGKGRKGKERGGGRGEKGRRGDERKKEGKVVENKKGKGRHRGAHLYPSSHKAEADGS